MSFAGIQLGRYQLHRILGSGGMGEVYLAEDSRINRQVAIKVVRSDPASHLSSESGGRAEQLFEREMQIISQLDHPYILPLYDYGEAEVDGATITYMVMPYRPEGSFYTWWRQHKNREPLAPQDVAAFIGQAASALHHAHERQVIHQDVKPSNFLIRVRPEEPEHPDLLLTDFGISRFATAHSYISHTIRGTPIYMAPEQWQGQATCASDQYALAVMAYELLVGNPPFGGRPESLMFKHLNEVPSIPSSLSTTLSPDIDAVLLRALAKQPEERFASIADFASMFSLASLGELPTATGSQPFTLTPFSSLAALPSAQPGVEGNHVHASLNIGQRQAESSGQPAENVPPEPEVTPEDRPAPEQAFPLAPASSQQLPAAFRTFPVLSNHTSPSPSPAPVVISPIPAIDEPSPLPAITPSPPPMYELPGIGQSKNGQPLAHARLTSLAGPGGSVPSIPSVISTISRRTMPQLTSSRARIVLVALALLLIVTSGGLFYSFVIAANAAPDTTLSSPTRAARGGHDAAATVHGSGGAILATQTKATPATTAPVQVGNTPDVPAQAYATSPALANANATATANANATATANANAAALANANATATAVVHAAITPLYRLYNATTGDHFYTTSAPERDNAVAHDGYQYEFIAGYVFGSQVASSLPLYRLYNAKTGDHFYTTSAPERDNAVAHDGYQYEFIAAYVYVTQVANTAPLYRLYNATTGDHFYTTSAPERDNAVAHDGYRYEWVACYVFTS